MLHQQIENDLKLALKSGDKEKAEILRFFLSAIRNFQIEKKAQNKKYLLDEDAILVLKRQAKQRRDSITQYEKGGRLDLAEKERKELKILEDYLPVQMGEEEIRRIVEMKITELGVSDRSGFGKLMGAVMSEIKGRAEGETVKKVIEEKLAGNSYD